MSASDVLDLGAILIAICALALSAYTTRISLRHQRDLAHEDRLWKHRVEAMLELLDWIDSDLTQVVPPAGSETTKDLEPICGAQLHTRLAAFFPDSLTGEVARTALAVGIWRRIYRRDEGLTSDDYSRAELSADRERTYLKGLAKVLVTAPPHQSTVLYRAVVDRHRKT